MSCCFKVKFVFVLIAEEGILRDTDRTEQSIKIGDAAGVVSHTSSIARRANRVLQVAQQEADNSEDPRFVDRVNESVRQLRNSALNTSHSALMSIHNLACYLCLLYSDCAHGSEREAGGSKPARPQRGSPLARRQRQGRRFCEGF